MTDTYSDADALGDLYRWFADDPARWLQGSFYKFNYILGNRQVGTDDVKATCLVGGVDHVVWRALGHDEEETQTRIRSVRCRLVAAGQAVYPRSNAMRAAMLPSWNDARGRRVDQVLTLVERAWHDAKAEEGDR